MKPLTIFNTCEVPKNIMSETFTAKIKHFDVMWIGEFPDGNPKGMRISLTLEIDSYVIVLPVYRWYRNYKSNEVSNQLWQVLEISKEDLLCVDGIDLLKYEGSRIKITTQELRIVKIEKP